MNRLIMISLTTALALCTGGCDEDAPPLHDGGHALDHGHLHDGPDQDTEGCAHLQKGPFVDLAAGADAAAAPAVKADHRAYRVALSANKAGFVAYAAADGGDHLFFLDRKIAILFLDDKGKAVSPEKSEATIKACAEVKSKQTVDLPAAGTYYLQLGPELADATVTLVIEPAGHEH